MSELSDIVLMTSPFCIDVKSCIAFKFNSFSKIFINSVSLTALSFPILSILCAHQLFAGFGSFWWGFFGVIYFKFDFAGFLVNLIKISITSSI